MAGSDQRVKFYIENTCVHQLEKNVPVPKLKQNCVFEALEHVFKLILMNFYNIFCFAYMFKGQMRTHRRFSCTWTCATQIALTDDSPFVYITLNLNPFDLSGEMINYIVKFLCHLCFAIRVKTCVKTLCK